MLLALSLALGVSIPVQAAEDNAAQDINKLLNQRLGAEAAGEVTQEQLALAKRKRVEVIGIGNTVLKNLNTLEATTKAWEDRLKALESNAEGQRIALDPANLEAYSVLRKKKPIDQDQIETLRQQVEATLNPLKVASNESPLMPSAALENAVKQDAETTRKALEEYERLQARVSYLIHQSAGKSVPSGSPSLKIALDEYERGQVEREMIIEKERQIKDEETIRQAKLEQKRALAEKEAERIRQETEMKKTEIKNEEIIRQEKADQERALAKKEAERIRQETEMKQSEADHERLVKLATSEAVLNRYAPFIAKGERVLKQPKGGEGSKRNPDKNGFWPKVNDPQPLSYSALNNWGAFSNVKMFSYIALSKWNPRPKGDFREPTTDADWKEMQERLDEFVKYAPIWQEKGLLAP